MNNINTPTSATAQPEIPESYAEVVALMVETNSGTIVDDRKSRLPRVTAEARVEMVNCVIADLTMRFGQ